MYKNDSSDNSLRGFIKILLIYILYHLCNPQTIPDTIPQSRIRTGEKSIVCYYGVYPY